MNRLIFSIFSIFIILISSASLSGSGKVYLVLGSDTAIWDGMNTHAYHCNYNLSLYLDPAQNAYKVMDPDFRSRLTDSFGRPMRLTWWMMAGNIFRYAVNNNMPIPNIMTLYLMNHYHGKNAEIIGDEISLHYHTFYWSDYDGDGDYWWNQSKGFNECRDDFDVTLAQMLLEEKVFPVSFRSGWHFMDNDWQHYLDQLLPYSLHDDWPVHGIDNTEPLDNNYDWSRAPSSFVPFRPSQEDYQIPGDGKGWNVRSSHFNTVRYKDLVDTIFAAAAQGTDQVACLWGHLPETDFVSNLEILDSLAHKMAAKYSTVSFKYCTAIEAMQLWRHCQDSIPPGIDFSWEETAGQIKFSVASDETIFQAQPFIAVKDIYERYSVLACEQTFDLLWQTQQLIDARLIAKAGLAVCDTFGNQTIKTVNFLPDDQFIDNTDMEYSEVHGSWSTSGTAAWGTDSRIATLQENDSVIVRWFPDFSTATRYNIFVQVPPLQNPFSKAVFYLYEQNAPVDTVYINSSMPPREWIYLMTTSSAPDPSAFIEMRAAGSEQAGKTAAADVLKISALVKDRDIHIAEQIIDFGTIAQEDTAVYKLTISNLGIEPLSITKISCPGLLLEVMNSLPAEIPGFSQMEFSLSLIAQELGSLSDSLLIESNDILNPYLKIPLSALVTDYFRTTDNENPDVYKEYGNWFFSNAFANGTTSRYSPVNGSPMAHATFTASLKKKGIYEIFEIVPTTVNAANHALYSFAIDGVPLDSLYLNQNNGSGGWVSLGSYKLPAGKPVTVKVEDDGTTDGKGVLRADAIKFLLIEEIMDIDDSGEKILPQHAVLRQNYPNPFNPATAIRYELPDISDVEISIYNLQGQHIRTVFTATKLPAGYHEFSWDASGMSSGVYIGRLQTNHGSSSVKMILLR